MKKAVFKLLSLVLLVGQIAFLTSCDPEEKVTLPNVTVVKSHFNLAKDSVELAVKTDVVPATDLVIPVRIATGADLAKEGEDFTLSAKQFVIKAGENVGTLFIKRNNENIGDDSKKVVINIESSPLYTMGATNFIEVALLGKNSNIVNFELNYDKIMEGQEAEYQIEMRTQAGGGYKSASETVFNLEVDKELSTAVEGVHFQISDNKVVTMAPNKWKTTFTVKNLKNEAGKDKLVIRVADTPGFAPGSNGILTIDLAPVDNFEGKWSYVGWNPYAIELVKLYGVDTSNAPQYSTSDVLEFKATTGGYEFTPNLKSELKDFFGNEKRTIRFDSFVTKELQAGTSMLKHKFSQFIVPGVNRNFDATAKTPGESKVSFRLTKVEKVTTLEVCIDDWKPVQGNFFYPIGDMMGFDMVWSPIRLYFQQAK